MALERSDYMEFDQIVDSLYLLKRKTKTTYKELEKEIERSLPTLRKVFIGDCKLIDYIKVVNYLEKKEKEMM